MSTPGTPANIKCTHEPYQGKCIHCGVPFVNGEPMYPEIRALLKRIQSIIEKQLADAPAPEAPPSTPAARGEA